ncbi:hypothetical protein FO519_006423 [Halicephalobus sp. NKZ332]|nr:hypothetical protein FO519_006423 [Halicephalobus sp. NKZ332]
MSFAIPVYEMVLKSNEDLTAPSQVIRLSPNETADVTCKIYDSGFEPDSLSFLENDKPVKNDRNLNSVTRRVKGNKHEMNFDCSAKRVNGSYQTRKMKVAPRLSRELLDDDLLCPTNKCLNNGLCVFRKGFESAKFCICTDEFYGENCQWASTTYKTPAGVNPNHLYASLGVLFIVAFIFALLYGRENIFRVKRKDAKRFLAEQKSSHHNADDDSLQNYEFCDGIENAIYEENKRSYIHVVNEYDNVPSDEKLQSRPLIKNQKKQNSLGVTEEVAQSQLKCDYSNISKPLRPPLTMEI